MRSVRQSEKLLAPHPPTYLVVEDELKQKLQKEKQNDPIFETNISFYENRLLTI